MTTYTIATKDDMLIATVPDGDDIKAAIREYCDFAGIDEITDYQLERGLTLTDEVPEDEDRVIWNARGGHGGFLFGADGSTTYNYAVR